jgi:hypothetical protein
MSEENPAPASSDDTEGHIKRSEPYGTESWRPIVPDDTGGHAGSRDAGDDDDAEGHARHFKTRDAGDDDDDTEGHARHF